MTTVSIVGRGGKTTIKTMLQSALNDVEISEGITDKGCDVITLAGLARPYRKDLQCITNVYTVIANADANYRIKMPNAREIIDYGLSRKATVTASSIIQEDRSQTFTCCVQRNIKTITGNVILPKEFLVKIDIPCKYNIYNALAAISVLMIFDITEDTISRALSGLRFDGNMEKIYDGDFSIVYNKVSNPYQLFSVLESQSENEYKNMFIVIDDFGRQELGMMKKIADILQEWSSIYNYNIYIQSGSSASSFIIDQLNLRKVVYKTDNMGNIIEDVLYRVKKGDKIILLGSEKIKNAWTDYLNITKE